VRRGEEIIAELVVTGGDFPWLNALVRPTPGFEEVRPLFQEEPRALERMALRLRASLYSWAQVSAWLSAARLGEVEHLAAETARACALIDAALTVRQGLRELPKHDRPLIARLVA